jgi:hypothetical protein
MVQYQEWMPMNDKQGKPASRRNLLRSGAAVAAAALAGLTAGRALAQDEKIAKNLVNYQDKPNNGQKCSNCAQFIVPNACKVVAGNISPDGWCAAFAPKDS